MLLRHQYHLPTICSSTRQKRNIGWKWATNQPTKNGAEGKEFSSKNVIATFILYSADFDFSSWSQGNIWFTERLVSYFLFHIRWIVRLRLGGYVVSYWIILAYSECHGPARIESKETFCCSLLYIRLNRQSWSGVECARTKKKYHHTRLAVNVQLNTFTVLLEYLYFSRE
jgi:hypothetical protein